jgi:hypothetical protein
MNPLRGLGQQLRITITAFIREIGWKRTTPCPNPPSFVSNTRSSSPIIVSGEVDLSG